MAGTSASRRWWRASSAISRATSIHCASAAGACEQGAPHAFFDDGVRVGSACVARKSDTVAKLRLLLVDPAARGHGLGRRLVGECTQFARSVGYRTIMLWTQSNLKAARHLYREAGYRRVSQEPNKEFGKKVTAETWTLDLTR